MAAYIYLSIGLIFHLAVFQYNKVDAASAVQGSTVQIICPYKASEGTRISWYKIVDGASIHYTESTQINLALLPQLTNRLTVTGDFSAGEQHLSISDVRKSDEGTYTCLLSGAIVNQNSQQLSVITKIPISVIIENVGLDNKLNGIEGRNLTIRCYAIGGEPAPDVKLLISESVVTVDKSTVQFTLISANRSYDGQNVTCLAGYEDISYYPLIKTARIYLKLKPYPPTFSSDSVYVESSTPLVISCTSTGSRPIALIYWLLRQTNVTINSTQIHNYHDQTTDTYTVTSILTYSLDRTHNMQNLTCGARNEAISEHGDSIETFKTLNVTYAPDITVNSPTYTQNDDKRRVTCNPSGNPNSYTYHKWQHKSKYGEIIREFDGSKTLYLPDVPVIFRYQDIGEYVCTASNGIKDKYNKFEQTGSGYLTVNAEPVFTSDTSDKVIHFGEISEAVEIFINVYSIPKFTIFIWSRRGLPITTKYSSKYDSSSSTTFVNDKIYGKEVQLDGYNLTLTIRDLKAEDFGSYTVTLNGGFADVAHTIVLESIKSSTTTNAFISGVVGAVVTLGIVCAAVIVILFLKRRKGQNQTDNNDTSYGLQATGLQKRQNNDEYEEVGEKCGVQQKQSNTTYESLGVKDMLNIYDGLGNPADEY